MRECFTLMGRSQQQILHGFILCCTFLLTFILPGADGAGKDKAAGAGEKLNIVFPPLVMPLALVIEKKEDWPQSLAALDAACVPRSWLLLGPRPDHEYKIFLMPKGLEPDRTDDWSVAPLDETGKPFLATLWSRPTDEEGVSTYVDLAQALGKDSQTLAYARTEVDWPVDGLALGWFEGDGHSMLYLNNQRVYMHDNDWAPRRTCVPLHMKAGRNIIKVKLGRNKGTWGFSFRLERDDALWRIELLQRLLELYPDESAGSRGIQARLEIARRYEQMKQFPEAQAAYQKARALYGENDEVRIEVDEALKRLQKEPVAAAGSPKLPLPPSVWPETEQKYDHSLRQGNASAADALMCDFIARYPAADQCGTALIYRGALRQDYGLAEDCRPYFERALHEYPQTPRVSDFAIPGLSYAQNLQAPQRVFETAHEAQAALEAARRQMAAGPLDKLGAEDVAKAMRNLSEVLRTGSGLLIRVGDARFYTRHVGTLEYVRAILASLTGDALATYVKTVGSAASERLHTATLSGDVAALDSVAAQYQFTPAAAQALNFAGNMYLDRGAYAEAVPYFRRLLKDYLGAGGTGGAAGISEALIVAKLAQAQMHAGQLAAAHEGVARLAAELGQSQLNIGGARVSGHDYARRLDERLAKFSSSTQTGSPLVLVLQGSATFGGNVQRSGAAAQGAAPEPGIQQPTANSQQPFAAPGGIAWTAAVPHSAGMAIARAKFGGSPFVNLQSFPVAEGERVFVSTLESLQALDINTGRRLWIQGWNSSGSLLPNQFTGFPISAPSVQDGKIFMRAHDGRECALRSYNVEGKLRWSTAAIPELKKVIWLSDPLVAYGVAAAPFIELSDGTSQHGVAAVDAQSGELRWKRILVSGETGIPSGNEKLLSTLQLGPPAAEEGILYTATGLGSMAAIDATSGNVIWLSGYPCARMNDPNGGNSNLTDSVLLRTVKLLSRGPVSPIVDAAENVVILAPKDAPGLIAFNRESGEVRWRHATLDSRFLAGLCDGNVLVVDDTVKALRASNGATVWEYALPGGLYSQPGYSGNVLYLPTKENLQLLDARSGKALLAAPWEARLGPLGNILIANQRVIGVNERAIAALGVKGGVGIEFPLEEARVLAAQGKTEAAAAQYEKAALSNPDQILEALSGRVDMLRSLNKKNEALRDIDQLLADKPAMLQSSIGNWRVSKEVFSNALRMRLGEAARAADILPGSSPGVAQPAGLSGILGYAWRLEADDSQLAFALPAQGGAQDNLWVYGGKSLYMLRQSTRQDVLWQTYLGMEDATVSVGPRMIAVSNAWRVAIVDRMTGELLWNLPLASLQNKTHPDVNLERILSVTLNEDSLAVLAQDGLFCFDLKSGKERWWNKQSERRVFSLAFVPGDGDGKLAEVSGNGGQDTVYRAYDIQSGKLLASNVLNPHTDWTWSANSPDARRMVFKTNPHTLQCVDLSTGQKLWSANVQNLEFKWENQSLYWEKEFVYYHGENKDDRGKGWMAYELNPGDGSVLREHIDGYVRLGNSYLNIHDGGNGRQALDRLDLEPGLGKPKSIWAKVLEKEQGEGCRYLKAFVSSNNQRLYVLFTRESASSHFVLRTFDWASGQLLNDDILPGTPFRLPEWGKTYKGHAELRGNLLLYTAADGVYAYTPLGENRRDSAAKLHAQLSDPFIDLVPASARRDLRRALAQVEPQTLQALLAPPDARVDGDWSVWAQGDPLPLETLGSFTPLTEGASWHGPNDLSARVYCAWNRNAVFVAVDVRDDVFVPPSRGTDFAGGDSVRVAVNAALDHRLGYDPKETVVCSLAVIDGRPLLNVDSEMPEDAQARPAAHIERRPDARGLRYVFELPWALLRHDPSQRPGNARDLRMGVAVYDNDAVETKAAMEWGAGIVNAGTGTSVFPPWLGHLSLLDISRERIEHYKQAISIIPDAPEAMQYMRLILAAKRGEHAFQERVDELSAFIKANPNGKNTLRALIFLRSLYKDNGDADAAQRAAAVARAAACPPPLIEKLTNTHADLDDKGTGLEGEYYDNVDFTNLKVTRVDPVIDFNWDSHSPDLSMAADTYSVRWTGQIRPLYTENYTFFTYSDDGVRLWVDDKLVVDNWSDQPPTEVNGTMLLSAGVKYDIKIEYYQNSGGAVMGLSWSSPSQKKEIVPQNCLFPPDFQNLSAATATATRQVPEPGGKADAIVTKEELERVRAGYRKAARLLADSADGFVLLRRVLDTYPTDAYAPRIKECESYLLENPETQNALALLQTLQPLYDAAGRDAQKSSDALIQVCKLPRDVRRAFFSQRVPGWTEWKVLGPVQAAGENRGMDQVLEPERAVNLAWSTKGPLDIPLAWSEYTRKKDDVDKSGHVDLFRFFAENLDGVKKGEIANGPYFAYAWRKVNAPTQRRATLFFGVSDTIAIWLNGKRIANPSSPGSAKDSQAVEVTLKEGENEFLIKAGIPNNWHEALGFYFRIADGNGRPFDDMSKN